MLQGSFGLASAAVGLLASALAIASEEPLPASVAARVLPGIVVVCVALFVALKYHSLDGWMAPPRMGPLSSRNSIRIESVDPGTLAILYGLLAGVASASLVLGFELAPRPLTALVLFLSYGLIPLAIWTVLRLVARSSVSTIRVEPTNPSSMRWGRRLNVISAYSVVVILVAWVVFAPSPDTLIKIDGDMGDWAKIPGQVDPSRDVAFTASTPTFDFTYPIPGEYDVVLNITDSGAASAETRMSVQVPNVPPTALLSRTIDGLNVFFDASNSDDPDDSIVQFTWNFGDGSTGSGVSVNHTYYASGVYVTTLTVVDSLGARSFSTAPVLVTGPNRPPVPKVTYKVDNFTLTASASGTFDYDGSVVAYSWDFGDNTSAEGIQVSHTFRSSGAYLTTLTITDDDGAKASHMKSISVPNSPPIPVLKAHANVLSVEFDARDSTDDGGIVSVKWSFGDDADDSELLLVRHTYLEPGEYQVTLTLTDAFGLESIEARPIRVSVPSQTVFAPVPSFSTIISGLHVHFLGGESYDPDGPIVSYSWDFGEGGKAFGRTVTHLYEQPGTYLAALTVVDEDGLFASKSVTIDLRGVDPSRTPPTPRIVVRIVQQVVTFDGTFSSSDYGPIVKYHWILPLPSKGLDLVDARAARHGTLLFLYARVDESIFPLSSPLSSITFYIEPGETATGYDLGGLNSSFAVRISGLTGHLRGVEILWYFNPGSTHIPRSWQVIGTASAAVTDSAVEVVVPLRSLILDPGTSLRITCAVDVLNAHVDTLSQPITL